MYLRYLYLSICFGIQTRTGSVIRPPGVIIDSVNDALTVAIWADNSKTVFRREQWRPRDEPDWSQPATLQRSLRAIALPEEPQITAALSTGTRFYYDLPTVRNFYAHKGRGSALSVKNVMKNYPVPTGLSPTAFLQHPGPRRPATVLETWLDDMASVFFNVSRI